MTIYSIGLENLAVKHETQGDFMTIQVRLKSVYGNDLIYPACTRAKIFTDLTGKKTLSRYDLNHIETLGFKIEWVI